MPAAVTPLASPSDPDLARLAPSVGGQPVKVSAQAAQGGLPMRDVHALGQVFTPASVVERMLGLRRNHGRALEPSCGDGAFSSRMADCVALELDAAHCPPGALNLDFFAYPAHEQFATVIGNPPYVASRHILPATRRLLNSRLLDGHANLYLHFIEKAVRHLAPGGELIFITPRDFLKATGAARLNTWLFEQGTITDFEELGDARIFAEALPNCAIWRFEKGEMSHRLRDGRRMVLANGQLIFARGSYSVPLERVFSVRVGAVSGADGIFTHATLGNREFVCSQTERTGKTRRMIYLDRLPVEKAERAMLAHLEPFKSRLLARRVTTFDEGNWWQWGRRHHVSAAPRIYVNGRTRQRRPFYLHPCNDYDGAVLALFPHRADISPAQLTRLVDLLNDVDWQELGFVCDGRFIFSQRSLAHALLPETFAEFGVDGLV